MLGSGEPQFRVSGGLALAQGYAGLPTTDQQFTGALTICAADWGKRGKVQLGRQNPTGGRRLLSLAAECLIASCPLPIMREGLGFND